MAIYVGTSTLPRFPAACGSQGSRVGARVPPGHPLKGRDPDLKDIVPQASMDKLVICTSR